MAPKGAKKTSAANHDFAIGDRVLGRIKGYPPWPAKIVDPDTEVYLTKAVRATKPAKAFAFLVRFYDDGNYAWQRPVDLQPLSQRNIEDFLSSGDKKKALLFKSYKTAKDPASWEAEHDKKMELAKKQDEEQDAGVDELDSDGEGGQKRKRKEASKKNAGKKAKKAQHSEDELAEKPAKKPKPTPEEEAAPGFKKSKEWRRELQKAFLSSTLPEPSDMPKFDAIYTDIEQYNDKFEYLEANKLPKVIKRIAQLDGIPREAEFSIKHRSLQIVEHWSTLLAAGAIFVKPASVTAPAQDSGAPQPPEQAVEEVKMIIDGEPDLVGGEATDISKMQVDARPTAVSSSNDFIQATQTSLNPQSDAENAKGRIEPPPTVSVAESAPMHTDATPETTINGNGEPVMPNGASYPAQSVA